MCLAACHWARVDAVYFAANRDQAAVAGFDDALIYRQLAGEAPHPFLLERLEHTDAFEPLARWLSSSHRVPY